MEDMERIRPMKSLCPAIICSLFATAAFAMPSASPERDALVVQARVSCDSYGNCIDRWNPEPQYAPPPPRPRYAPQGYGYPPARGQQYYGGGGGRYACRDVPVRRYFNGGYTETLERRCD